MKEKAALVVLVILAAGCGTKPGTSPAPGLSAATPPPQTGAPTPVKSTLPAATPMPNPAASTEGDEKGSAPVSAGPSLDSIPQELRAEAFDYYGLGNTKPLDYEVDGDTTAGVRTGSLTTILKEVKDGKAYFDQVRSGGLYVLGNDELSLDAQGVHVISSTVETVAPNNIELPANVAPGSTWKSHDTISQSGLTFDVNSVSTVKGVQPLQTKRGTLQALLITSKSEGTQNGKELRMDSETYYVKGVGLAKAVMKTTVGTSQHSTVTLQLAN